MALEPGDVIAERYRIDRKLGEGGMGSVFRATQLGLSRAVALKVLRGHNDTAAVRKRFEREAHVLAALQHPGAVQVFDFGEHDGELFLVMELLIGRSLREALLESPLTVRSSVRVVHALADVLVTTHEIALVHRDIKPDNVFLEEVVDEEDRVKLVDFGLAFIADQGDLGRLTRDGLVSGTPQYVSPEQARDEGVGPPSDIYSLGVLFFRLLADVLPFRGSVGELVSSHLYATPPRPSSFKPEAAPLDAFVGQMLAKDASARPTAVEIREFLGRFLDGDIEDRANSARSREERQLDTTEAETLDSPATSLFGVDLKDRGGRAGRQLGEMPRRSADTRQLRSGAEFAIVVRGELEANVVVALAQRGIEVIEDDQGADAVLLLGGADLDEVRAACAEHATVIADAQSADLVRSTELLRAGAADVLTSPFAPETIARKVERTLRRRAR